jgi:hypothetical protein
MSLLRLALIFLATCLMFSALVDLGHTHVAGTMMFIIGFFVGRKDQREEKSQRAATPGQHETQNSSHKY